MTSTGDAPRMRGRGRLVRPPVEGDNAGNAPKIGGDGDMGSACKTGSLPAQRRVPSSTSLDSELSGDTFDSYIGDAHSYRRDTSSPTSDISASSKSASATNSATNLAAAIGHVSLRDTVSAARGGTRMRAEPSAFPNPFAPDARANNIANNVGVRPSCPLAAKLPPAAQRETVLVTTNIFPIEVDNRVIYRYDVRITTSSRDTSKERVRDLCKGDRDDSEVTLRHRKCMLLLRRGLELYRLLSEQGAYIYDLSSTLFTNEAVNKELLPRLTISAEQMNAELRRLMGNVDVHIEVTPCVESAHTFNLADFAGAVTGDLARQDHSLRQFFEILTNQSPLQNGTHFAFGSGKLFPFDGSRFGLTAKPLSDGRTLVAGADKGIRFIEGSRGSGIIPALVLDSKKAAFFDAISLPSMVRKMLMKGDDGSQPFPLLDNERIFNEFHRKINDVVRDLRLQHVTCTSRSFVASGLSDKPVGQIMVTLGRGGTKAKVTVVDHYKQQGIQIRPDLPAVRLTTPFGTTYFPMEVLSVAPFQRVPISKQTPSQMKDTIKECAVPPSIRFAEISRNLQALDLDLSRRFNPYLEAFGVRISSTPLQVEGHRRVAPKVQYAGGYGSDGGVVVDARNANWKMNGKQYLVGAELRCWYVLYDEERDRSAVGAFVDALVRECRKKGIVMSEQVVEHVPFEHIDECFSQIRECHPDEQIFVMYVDSRDGTHDELKLCEVLYQIVTQHVHMIRARDAPKKVATLENIMNKLNCKNFGQCYGIVPENFAVNRWINCGRTLIIGYDVCHPEPQPKHERRLKLPPTQPSVLGISFNGAACEETFIGDYAFQEPRKEQVTSSLLERRAFWIMKLFRANHNGALPDTVVITRDGVSEGQFRMVMESEVEAIRAGIRNFGVEEAGVSDYAPKIVCIIACKRHFKRFAIETDRGYENCLPLTVIDKDITRPDVTEFFMQSHKVIKGTGKLPSYSIPINEAKLTMDEAQSLMMALCFTHQIVNQAISIPEPIYQADEWAKRGRNNFKAMLRRSGSKGDLPKTTEGGVDWEKITNRLCYMGSQLELTRSNA